MSVPNSEPEEGTGDLALHQRLPSQGRHILPMAHSVFRCPTTGFNVQHHLDDDRDITETEYEAITCLACAKLHFINRKTGRVLGQDKVSRNRLANEYDGAQARAKVALIGSS